MRIEHCYFFKKTWFGTRFFITKIAVTESGDSSINVGRAELVSAREGNEYLNKLKEDSMKLDQLKNKYPELFV